MKHYDVFKIRCGSEVRNLNRLHYVVLFLGSGTGIRPEGTVGPLLVFAALEFDLLVVGSSS